MASMGKILGQALKRRVFTKTEVQATMDRITPVSTEVSLKRIDLIIEADELYAEAEKRNLLVAGITNRTEFILGDFCKYGDGGTDIEPFTHLYKNQIYQLSDYLEVIPEIVNREPSPDTFSLPVSDQEFFFRISFDKLDYLLYAWEHEVAIKDAAKVLDLSEDAIGRAYKDFADSEEAGYTDNKHDRK